MKLTDALVQFSETVSRGASLSVIVDAQRDLATLAADLEYEVSQKTADPQTVAEIKLRVCVRALELQQGVGPALDELVAACLTFAGKDVLKVALAPITRLTTDRTGSPMAPIPSPYIDPSVYAASSLRSKR